MKGTIDRSELRAHYRDMEAASNAPELSPFDACWARIVVQVQQIMEAVPGGTWRD